jgi:hypothetical protein
MADLKLGKWAVAEAELQAQIEKAVKTGEQEFRTQPRAERAEYDRKSNKIWIYLNNKCVFGFPPAIVKELAGAAEEEIEKVKVNPIGDALHWDDLNAHYTIAGLLAGVFGTRRWMQELGRKGGLSTSGAKSAAARKNGAKGGRPRKVVGREV